MLPEFWILILMSAFSFEFAQRKETKDLPQSINLFSGNKVVFFYFKDANKHPYNKQDIRKKERLFCGRIQCA